MVKWATTAFSLLLSLAATFPAAAQKQGHSSGTTSARPALRFLDAIEMPVSGSQQTISSASPEQVSEPLQQAALTEMTTVTASDAIETSSALQLKYAILLDTEVEQVQNTALFSLVDEWYGTRYVLGGSSRDGIDCSAFVQAVYSKLFQIPMPRTVKEQHGMVRQIPRTELRQGDLVFFTTRGSSVSHVGIYLQNNKFVHAATSGGVMASDLFEEYWVKRFAGAGRYETASQSQPLMLKP